MANHNKQNVITLTNLGEFCKEYVTGEKGLSCSVKSMQEFKVENAENLQDIALDIYMTISILAELRENQGLKEDLDQLNIAKQKAEIACYKWFKAIGTRPPKKEGGKVRSAYTLHEADYVRIGEICQQARELAENDLAKISQKFFELLVIATGKQILGENIGRVTEDDFKKATKEFNKIKAEKAKKTKEQNSKNEKVQADVIAEKDSKIAELEIELKQALKVDINKLITMIQDSDATEAQKAEIINYITQSEQNNQ